MSKINKKPIKLNKGSKLKPPFIYNLLFYDLFCFLPLILSKLIIHLIKGKNHIIDKFIVNIQYLVNIYLFFLGLIILITVIYLIKKCIEYKSLYNFFEIIKLEQKIKQALIDKNKVNKKLNDNYIEVPNVSITLVDKELIVIRIKFLPGLDYSHLKDILNLVKICICETKFKKCTTIRAKEDLISNCFELYCKGYDNTIILNSDFKKDLIRKDLYEITLQKGLVWNIVKYPHMLIAGITGSGKSTVLFSLIIQFLYKNFDLTIFDFKHEFETLNFNNKVFSDKEEILEQLRSLVIQMNNREKFILEKLKEQNKISFNLEDYKKMNLQPKFLIIDEVGSLISDLDKKEKEEFISLLTQISQKGRSSLIFLILATQQPSVDTIPSKIREQLSTRILLGNNGEDLKKMVFDNNIETIESNIPKFKGYFMIKGYINTPDYYHVMDLTDENFSKIDTYKKVYLEGKNKFNYYLNL